MEIPQETREGVETAGAGELSTWVVGTKSGSSAKAATFLTTDPNREDFQGMIDILLACLVFFLDHGIGG